MCPEKSLDPLGHHAITCKHGGDVVFRHNRLWDIVAETCRLAHFSIHLEGGQNLSPDHSNTRLADILVLHWCMGKPVALDLSVTSLLKPTILPELKQEWQQVQRMFNVNVAKCADLGWVCFPAVANSYRTWGLETRISFPNLHPISGKIKVCGPPWNLWEAKHAHC